tara:strand:- start:451 stop:627 length:177 start_codon:yes stop_codon:yes gene_type:complete
MQQMTLNRLFLDFVQQKRPSLVYNSIQNQLEVNPEFKSCQDFFNIERMVEMTAVFGEE